jgi:hypothetical protein
MRLFFLDPTSRASINVRRLRNYGFDTRRIVAQDAGTLDKLIVLGDGSPEDEIMGILSHHHDGERIIGIVKPETAGMAALDHLRNYASGNVQKILFITDQDGNGLEQFFQLARERIELTGRVQSIENCNDDDRVRIYHWRFSNKLIDIIVVASGSEDLDTRSHEIEDHLLMIAGITSHVQDSKEQWRALDESEREDVLRLTQNKDLFEIAFHQHVCGCNCLER